MPSSPGTASTDSSRTSAGASTPPAWAARRSRRVSFLFLLEYLEFGYVLRITAKVIVRGRPHEGLLRSCGPVEREEIDFGEVPRGRGDDDADRLAVDARGGGGPAPGDERRKVAEQGPRHIRIAHGRGGELPGWPNNRTVRTFGRDLKSHRYGAALRYVKLSSPERYEWLFMLWAMGAWLLHGQGHSAIDRNLHLGLSSVPNARWDLSAVRIGRETLTLPLGRPPALLRAMAA